MRLIIDVLTCRRSAASSKVTAFWVCQLDLAHFDAFIWPTLEANDLSGAG
jgi:hypothetical protein